MSIIGWIILGIIAGFIVRYFVTTGPPRLNR
jgi:uncharacterized membrane protein YeaQ/YmgE (transglycosylase-associated protein family)